MKLKELMLLVRDLQKVEVEVTSEDGDSSVCGMRYALIKLLDAEVMEAEIKNVECIDERLNILVEL